MKALNEKIPAVLQSMFIIAFGNLIDSSYSPLAPFIKNHFVLTAAQLGLITSVIFIGSSSMSFFTGIFVDRIGYRNAMKISFAIMATGSIIIFRAVNYPFLLSGFYFIGFGYGLLTPATNSHIMSKYFPEHLTRMGIKQAGVPMGAAVSAIVLPVIALNIGISYTYLVVFIIAVAIVFIIPFRKITNQSVFNFKQYIKDFGVAVKNRDLMLVSGAGLFLSWVQQSVLTYYVVYYRSENYQTISAEILLFTVLISAIAGRIMWTWLGRKMFHGNHIRTFSVIMAVTAVTLIAFPHFSGIIYMAVLFSIFIGITAISWNGVFVSITSEVAPKEMIGMFSGVSIIIISLGTIVGTPISGFIVDHFKSYMYMWTAMGVTVIFVALAVYIMSYRIKSSKGLM